MSFSLLLNTLAAWLLPIHKTTIPGVSGPNGSSHQGLPQPPSITLHLAGHCHHKLQGLGASRIVGPYCTAELTVDSGPGTSAEVTVTSVPQVPHSRIHSGLVSQGCCESCVKLQR